MSNIFYMIIAAVIAILLAAFLYIYQQKKSKITYILLALRTISFFLILLLLLNLQVTKRSFQNIKPKLHVLVDNSESIAFAGQQKTITKIVQDIQNQDLLNQKFDIQYFSFGNNIKPLDSLNFSEKKTNITKAIKEVNQYSNTQKMPTILISDGNQTIGKSYEFINVNNKIFPIVIGDTTNYQDVYINQLNANKYAYLKHQFPVEVFINYNGNNVKIPVNFTVKEGSKTIFSEKITLGKEQNYKNISFYLPANKKGLHHYQAGISNLKKEKNTLNNHFNFSVEVISEQSKTLLISDIIHPDIAFFKRTIESNEQRKLVLKKPTDNINLDQYNNIILYQPQANFKPIFNQLQRKHKNIFFVTGSHTNWQILNDLQAFFKRKYVNKEENYTALFNKNFNTFLLEDIGFENFPPVQDKFGEIHFNVPFQSILFQKINNFTTDQPLMATFHQENQRYITFFGENIWRWRLYEGKEKQDFKEIDSFINKCMQFLDAQNKGDLLKINYKKNYFSNEEIKIKAQVFDLNYQFNPKEKLWITATGNQKSYTYPFALEATYYQVLLSDLPPATYSFKVYNNSKSLLKKGSFSVLNYAIEQQKTGGNKKELTALAKHTNGKVYYPKTIHQLIANLSKDTSYATIQKSKITKTSLIDWKLILALIIISLTAEWLIRKYKGFI